MAREEERAREAKVEEREAKAAARREANGVGSHPPHYTVHTALKKKKK